MYTPKTAFFPTHLLYDTGGTILDTYIVRSHAFCTIMNVEIGWKAHLVTLIFINAMATTGVDGIEALFYVDINSADADIVQGCRVVYWTIGDHLHRCRDGCTASGEGVRVGLNTLKSKQRNHAY